MTITEAVTCGVVQGLTEFLPVSSSGHLVLIHSLLGSSSVATIFFDVCLHAATVAAVLLYFRRDILQLVRERNRRWLFCLTVGTIPAVIAALLFRSEISAFFASPRKTAAMLIVTAVVLFLGQLSLWKKKSGARSANPTFIRALAVGLAQACALIPGISRSGMTISTGLVSGMKIREAFRFSFLLSIPIVAAAAVYEMFSCGFSGGTSGEFVYYAIGMVSAFITGLLSLRLLWWIMKRRNMFVFSIYCVLLGAGILLFWK